MEIALRGGWNSKNNVLCRKVLITGDLLGNKGYNLIVIITYYSN